MANLIDRGTYLSQLVRAQGTDLVKIVTGVRRCGKSTLLRLFERHLAEQGVAESEIVKIDFERYSSFSLRDPEALYEHVRGRVERDGARFLIVDEAQEIERWAQTVNALRAEFSLDVYLTGSNSQMFSGEYLTYISGRYVEVRMLPLSFAEYLEFKGETGAPRPEAAYGRYVASGSFPAVALVDDDLLADSILAGLFDSVFSRDIVLRGRIRNEAAFYKVAKFVLGNVGSQTSASSIARTLSGQGHSVNSDTVDSYLKLMCDAFLLYPCERYDIRGKERLRTNGKYYVVDTGLRNRLLGRRDSDRGHVTENVVYLELLRRGYEVFVGKTPRAEIDFVAQAPGTRHYVQVADTAADPSTLAREMAPFAELDDGFPRILITKDWEDLSADGVRHMNLYEFLMGDPAVPDLLQG